MNENDEASELNRISLNEANNINIPLDWKNEVINGNFMPVIMKLIRNEIDSDCIVDHQTGNRILHFAVYYGCLNVVRVLIEKYNSNINVRNNFGHTPFHILCNQTNLNLHLFAYIVKNDKSNFDSLDNSNVSPICFTINSHSNLAFLYLAHNNCQLYTSDIYNNNLLYWVLSSDNKFVLKFLLAHLNFDVNCSFFNNTKSLSDNLIANPHRKCAKYLLKYFNDKINISSLMSTCLNKEKFSFHNNHNYELLRALYAFKVNNVFQLLRFIFSEVLFSFNFKAKTIHFLFDLYINFIPVFVKFFICFMNISIKLIIFLYTKDDHPNIVFNEEGKSKENYMLNTINCIIPIAFYIFSLLALIALKPLFSGKVIYERSKGLNEPTNILRIISEQIMENVFELPSDKEICSVCLIKKSKDTRHCNICNKCVNDFFFHSKLFNKCFSKTNLFSYLLYTFSMLFINLLLFLSIANLTIKTSPFSTNYVSHFIIILIFSNYYSFLMLLSLLIEIVYYLQKFLINLYAIGYRTTYKNLFRLTEHHSNLQFRNNNLCFIPESNLVTLSEFCQNIGKFVLENIFN